jgi:hypothetical protein
MKQLNKRSQSTHGKTGRKKTDVGSTGNKRERANSTNKRVTANHSKTHSIRKGNKQEQIVLQTKSTSDHSNEAPNIPSSAHSLDMAKYEKEIV